jgi:hypothetical protein
MAWEVETTDEYDAWFLVQSEMRGSYYYGYNPKYLKP